ncbi:MAG: hypothetical protein EP343_01020 [Deltaproteobacteria bacterium]|nr:MAG: hypothetical protein EP343_01020 [Deltaproteobacteria bacterium]
MHTAPEAIEASTRLLFDEATKRGIACELLGDPHTILMNQGEHHWYVRGSRTSFQSSVGKTIADIKLVTKRICRHFNLPTAAFVHVKKAEDLEKVASLQYPLVMKPVDLRHGEGVVVGIPDMEASQRYYSRWNRPAIFEEMLEGREYRVLCIDFQFVAAAWRKPAFVTGDGQHTIEELIAEKNRHPWRGEGHQGYLTRIEVDDLVQEYLTDRGLTLQSVPADGEEVKLRKTGGLSTGGEAWDVTDLVCDENRELFGQIARACDLNTIGIDMMCSSLETPIVGQEKAGIIEVNASPGLRMHHYPMQGTPRNVAGLILDMVERNLQRL